LVDIVEWIDHTADTLVWRFPRYHNQIKNGASLIVRPGQTAIFVHRGQIADVFDPGHFELSTDNLPLLSTLQGWKHGFDSPFKAEIYFVSTTQVSDLKWGTPRPIMLRDPEFGPIRVRAFGTYTLKATHPTTLLKELVGTDGMFESDEISELVRSMIVSAFAEVLGQANIAALDLASKYGEIAEQVRANVVEQMDFEYGLTIPQLYVVNVSLPQEVERALDKKTSMTAIGDMGAYQQYQMGQAITAAATNPSGGGAADGMGLGLGFAMAKQMMGNAAAGTAVPPIPSPIWHAACGGKITGVLTEAELAQAIAKGEITTTTLLWTQGASKWMEAAHIPQLANLFISATPPPLPPQ